MVLGAVVFVAVLVVVCLSVTFTGTVGTLLTGSFTTREPGLMVRGTTLLETGRMFGLFSFVCWVGALIVLTVVLVVFAGAIFVVGLLTVVLVETCLTEVVVDTGTLAIGLGAAVVFETVDLGAETGTVLVGSLEASGLAEVVEVGAL